jgi:hypothetical protein
VEGDADPVTSLTRAGWPPLGDCAANAGGPPKISTPSCLRGRGRRVIKLRDSGIAALIALKKIVVTGRDGAPGSRGAAMSGCGSGGNSPVRRRFPGLIELRRLPVLPWHQRRRCASRAALVASLARLFRDAQGAAVTTAVSARSVYLGSV